MIFFHTHNMYIFSKNMSHDCKTVFFFLKTSGHFSMTNVDSIVDLSLSKMIKVFLYLKTENIWQVFKNNFNK